MTERRDGEAIALDGARAAPPAAGATGGPLDVPERLPDRLVVRLARGA